jgi:hypothetical protein
MKNEGRPLNDFLLRGTENAKTQWMKIYVLYAHWLKVFDLSLLLAGSHFWKYPSGWAGVSVKWISLSHTGRVSINQTWKRTSIGPVYFFWGGGRWGEANFRVFSVNSKKSIFFWKFYQTLETKKIKIKIKN